MRNEDDSIKEVMYHGAGILCNNGYIKWSNLIYSYKHTSNCKEIRFLEWLESMQKDAEYTFGILKHR